MQAQEIVDDLEAAAFARYLAMRTAWGPCWGLRGRAHVVAVKPRAGAAVSPVSRRCRWPAA